MTRLCDRCRRKLPELTHAAITERLHWIADALEPIPAGDGELERDYGARVGITYMHSMSNVRLALRLLAADVDGRCTFCETFQLPPLPAAGT